MLKVSIKILKSCHSVRKSNLSPIWP